MDKNHKNTIELLQQNAQELPLLTPDERCWVTVSENLPNTKKKSTSVAVPVGAIAASIIVVATLFTADNWENAASTKQSISENIKFDEIHQTSTKDNEIYWRIREIDAQLLQPLTTKYRTKLSAERAVLLKKSNATRNNRLTII